MSTIQRYGDGSGGVCPLKIVRRMDVQGENEGAERTMRTEAPNACGGMFDLNFDLTAPLLP